MDSRQCAHDSTYSYIPGFRYPFPNSLNLHNHVYRIGNNLYVAGIGGSPPAYDQNHTLVWTGFPFVKGDVDPTALEEEMARIPQSASIILFTHAPPDLAPTSIAVSKENRAELIIAGSASLSNLLKRTLSNYRVPLYLHGHCHVAVGSNTYHGEKNSTVILNPGSYRDGRVARITLTEREDMWIVSSQEFYTLS
ncbi:hypothetical protein BLSTO_03615 [Blastocystis sp. subtype 1]